MEKNIKTTEQANRLISRITEIAPKLDVKIQALLNKGLTQVVQQLKSLAKSARINVEDLIDVVETTVEGDDVDKKTDIEQKDVEIAHKTGQKDLIKQYKDKDGKIEHIKTVFEKFKPDEKEFFKKHREFIKSPEYKKIQQFIDELDEDDFIQLFS